MLVWRARTPETSVCIRFSVLRLNRFHPSDFPTLQTDFDAVWMSGRVGQNLFHHPVGQLPRPLVLFGHNRNPKPWSNLCADRTTHDSLSFCSVKSAMDESTRKSSLGVDAPIQSACCLLRRVACIGNQCKCRCAAGGDALLLLCLFWATRSGENTECKVAHHEVVLRNNENCVSVPAWGDGVIQPPL